MVIYLNEESKKFAEKRRKEDRISKTLDVITIITCSIAAIVATLFLATIL